MSLCSSFNTDEEYFVYRTQNFQLVDSIDLLSISVILALFEQSVVKIAARCGMHDLTTEVIVL
jgi:hypothetical protein